MLDLVVLLISVAAMTLLGLAVVIRNIRNRTYQLFGLLTLTSIAWFTANYFTNHVQGHGLQLFINKLSLFVGFLLIEVLWLLSLYFPRKLANHSWQRYFSVVATPVLLYVTLFTNGVVADVVYRPERNLTEILTGNLYTLYILGAAIFFGFLAFNFYKSYKSKKLTRVQHQQVLSAATGLLLAFVWSIATAVVIPSLTNNWEISKYGAVGSWFIVSFVSYAIVRHKLFDIRLIVARSLAYILLLASLAALYTLSIVLVTDQLFKGNRFMAQVVPLVAAIILVFLAPTFRKFFDRITNRFFYRDAYEPQLFLDELNRVLVSQVELDQLLKKSLEAISASLKSEYCYFIIRKTAYSTRRVVGQGPHTPTEEDMKELENDSSVQKTKVIARDYIEETNSSLVRMLRDSRISVLVRLTPSVGAGSEGVGYLVLGDKKSGNPYNRQDMQTLDIIANELVIAIQNALRFEEIESFAETLQQKVDDATGQLRRTNEKLKALDETKDEFISMASHQLRTPLTSVKGYLSMVLEGDTGKITPAQRKMLDQAFVSSQRMVYLIADLLNVSRLRTGKFIIEPVPTNLADAISGELDQLHETAAARELTVKYDKPADFPVLMLDETKTRQVLMNFIDNAIYYTPNGGNIDVSLKDKGETIEFTVTDDGIGVPRAEQHHLFNKFYRAGNARKARPDGTGLGLFMAKKVIVAQGGHIIFQSTEGKGSTFGFSFAKAKLKPSTAMAAGVDASGAAAGPGKA